jgi:protein tyrosine phosphatase type 4A
MRFMVMDAPSDSNLELYLNCMETNNVKHCVRVCEPTYCKEQMEERGIAVYDWVFPDGEAPPELVISDWLSLVNQVFGSPSSPGQGLGCIATHCVAGLGRAPVLVAIALIEAGMSPLDAVTYIRERRRGAINSKQLRFLEQYKKRSRRQEKCTIM